MNKNNVTNTAKRVSQDPFLGLMDALNITAAEQRGQQDLIKSTSMPRKWNRYKGDDIELKKQYELMGIKVIGEIKDDPLFFEVVLPEGWKKRSAGGYESELIDDKGRVRATFFYKAAFYDRDAFINFNTRYGYCTITYLPSEEKGHYEMKDVKRPNPYYKPRKGTKEDVNDEGYIVIRDRDGYIKSFSEHHMKYITTQENVWVRKYEDDYEEYNNTPHYYELTDGGNVFFTTKDDPIFYREKHDKENHEKWWDEFSQIRNRMDTMAKDTLNKKFPAWRDINAYWDGDHQPERKKLHLPRKLKKGLKAAVLKPIDSRWRTKDVRILSVKKRDKYARTRPTFRGITVSSYTLG